MNKLESDSIYRPEDKFGDEADSQIQRKRSGLFTKSIYPSIKPNMAKIAAENKAKMEAYNKANPVVQTKSEISQPGDASELQADKVAEAVTKGDSENAQVAINEKVADVAPKGGDGSLSTNPEFDSQLQSSKNQGQKLDDNVKSEMEGYLGSNLSGVNIHKGEKADKMSRNINAKAFTHGQDIYFKDGNYDPTSTEGKKLLAHELTHTVQQGEGMLRPMLQRTEVDTTATPYELKDSKGLIDAHVNKIISNARNKVLKNENDHKQKKEFIDEVFDKLGEFGESISDKVKYLSKIEIWAKELGKEYVYLPDRASTKYAGVKDVFWKTFQVLGHSMKVAGENIGSDKLGHFFQQGHEYFVTVYNIQKKREENPKLEEETVGKHKQKLTEIQGYDSENKNMGKATTGVFSFADLQANIKGYQFYIDLYRNPNMKFEISTYIKEIESEDKTGTQNTGISKSSFSEEKKPSAYRADIAKAVWKNIITSDWKATDTEGKTKNGLMELKADELVTGTLYYKVNSSSSDEKREIKNGNIEYSNASLNIEGKEEIQKDIFKGVFITCDWKQEGRRGKVVMTSISEQSFSVLFLNEGGQQTDKWSLTRKALR
jgi:Domain of unknown function (DUF4157)